MIDELPQNARSATANDHVGLTDLYASRRYFAKFERITGHLNRVAAVMQADSKFDKDEVEVLTAYVQGIAYTFRALSMKYLLVGRDTGRFFGSLAMDVRESGFPVFNELMVMANDAHQAGRHLQNMPDADTLKRQMVEQIGEGVDRRVVVLGGNYRVENLMTAVQRAHQDGGDGSALSAGIVAGHMLGHGQQRTWRAAGPV